MSDFDVNELVARLQLVTDEMAGAGDRVRAAVSAAHTTTFHVADHDGLAEITADGRPRLTGVHLHRDALHLHPDDLDHLLTTLLNEVLGEARRATGDAVFEALPQQIRTEITRVTDR
ncbi:MAG TPA: hypothetical protein VN408_11650 [Actinoplanes sp.]|nr:hypothetical protein [Actinoplanes sp.]